jgi:hypothetical protein
MSIEPWSRRMPADADRNRGVSLAAALTTASATLLVAVLLYVLNQRSQVRLERRQARLARVNSQLRDLYGPLNALVDANETVWRALRDSELPEKERRRSGNLSAEQSLSWSVWVNRALMPANQRMREIIVTHADLIVEPRVPDPLRLFCAHVAAYEAFLGGVGPADEPSGHPVVHHPGRLFVDYVRQSFSALKCEQARLLGLTT